MSPEAVLDHVVEEIADGASVDWGALDKESSSDADREWLRALRIVSDVANVHRAIEAPAPDAHATTVLGKAATAEVLPDGAPRAWGRYRLDHKVGEGSFGRVYRAWDPELEREIAIKILHRQVSDERLKDRLLREGRALAKIRHPNVVSVLGIEAHEGRVGLCMEFVRGETLANHVRSQRTLSAREAIVIGEDLCRALAAVHRAGFVHRDVKARNVMREEAGRIVLMDFGTGTDADAAAWGLIDIAGTPAYMAPEALAGDPATAKSDIYSLGVLLYHLVTGAYPVEGVSVGDVRDAHTLGRRHLLSERRPDLPVSFIRVIERAIAADPDGRYASAGELLEALGGIDMGRPHKVSVLTRVAAVVAASLAALTMIGFVTSMGYYATIGLTANFRSESWLLVPIWGLRSLLAPAVLGVALASAGLVLFRVARLAVRGSAIGRKITDPVARRLDATTKQLLSMPTSAAAPLLLFVQCLIVALTLWWSFSDFIAGVDSMLLQKPGDALMALAPANHGTHRLYRQVLSLELLTFAGAWVGLLKARFRRGERSGWLSIGGGIAATAYVLVMLVFPYRLISHNAHERVIYGTQTCYLLGDRGNEALLLCPSQDPPRNRVVRLDDPVLQRTGFEENPFAHLHDDK